ncbi:MAG TPA: DMT family transporter, partial [Rectinemataceae bacterium]|nr:DMT family transporter [Rectinemataceae bacterium]
MGILNIGAVAALATALSWTITAIAFEYAGKRIGAFALNFLRLVLGMVFLGLYCLVVRGSFFPLDAPASAWLWLSASGIVGLVVGDLLLFQAFIDIGSRVSMLLYASAPALTAVLGFGILGERLAGLALLGMALTLAGIAIVVLGRGEGQLEAECPEGEAKCAPRARRIRGLACALGGALGQAAGLILSKVGAGSMDPFAGTQIRVSAAVLGFAVVLAASGAWRGTFRALKDGKAIASLGLGSFFGPFLGVSLSLLAVQTTKAGLAAAIMSIVPILIIAPSALIYKERVQGRDVLGSVVA